MQPRVAYGTSYTRKFGQGSVSFLGSKCPASSVQCQVTPTASPDQTGPRLLVVYKVSVSSSTAMSTTETKGCPQCRRQEGEGGRGDICRERERTGGGGVVTACRLVRTTYSGIMVPLPCQRSGRHDLFLQHVPCSGAVSHMD